MDDHGERIAVLETKVDGLVKSVGHLDGTISRLTTSVETLNAFLNRGRGAWALVTAIGVVLALVVAAAAIGDKIAGAVR